jgi:hypothetical protein
MKMTVRRCDQCGKNDTRRTWSSLNDAADDGALDGWVCPTCAWTEAELIEVDATPAGSADPLAPVSPDDARHAVVGSRPGV